MYKIKRFFKFIAYPYAKSYLKTLSQRKIPITLLATGAGLLGVDIWYYLYLFLGNAPIATSQLEDWITVASKVVGLLLIGLGGYWCHRLMVKAENTEEEKSKVILKQFSIDSSEKNETSNNPKSLMYVILDQRKNDDESKVNWIKRCLNQQKEKIEDYFYVAERWDQPASYYEGLAHIPFVFLLGYQVSDKINFSFSEWNEHAKKWIPLPEIADNFPSLVLEKNIQESEKEATDVTICISLTSSIQEWQLEGLIAQDCNIYHLKLKECKRHAIVCLKQLEEYKHQFRKLLDEINNTYPRLRTVHIFISAQTSLVFNIGSALTRNDKETWIYNYEVNSKPLYPWGIKAHKATKKGYQTDKYIKIVEEE